MNIIFLAATRVYFFAVSSSLAHMRRCTEYLLTEVCASLFIPDANDSSLHMRRSHMTLPFSPEVWGERITGWNQTSPSGYAMARKKAESWHTPESNERRVIYGDVWDSKQELLGWTANSMQAKTRTYCVSAPLKRGLWGWWSWWGFSCNHLPHLVAMATQPEARALGRRGGNREREGCWEAWPSVWLPRLSFRASTNWTWHLKRKKEKMSTAPWAYLWLSHSSSRFDLSEALW